MRDARDRYHPRQFDEITDNGTSLINEVPPENVVSIVRTGERPIHTVLVESLNSTQALLTRLENGVHVPRNNQRVCSMSPRGIR
jgi:hypothetical protein